MMNQVTLSQIIGKDGIFVDGDWVETKDQDPTGSVRLIQLADVGERKFVNKSKRYLTIEKATELKCTFLKPGDVLVARMPDPIGRACIFPELGEQCVTVVDVCIIRPDKTLVSAEWLMYQINSQEFRNKIKKYITGTTRQRISRGNLDRIKFNIPTLEEQKRIVKILDQADSLRQKRKQAINLLDEYIKSAFLDLFGDPINNPKNWDKYDGNKYAKKLSVGVVIKPASYYVEKGVPALRSQNITTDGIAMNNLVFFSSVDNETKLSKSIIRENDVLIVRTGQPGTAAIVPKELDGANCIDVIIVKLDQEIITPEYLVAFFNSAGGKDIVLKSARGQIQQHFNIGALSGTQIPIPPLKIQQQFSNIFNKHKYLKRKMLLQAEYFESQFQALMHKSFASS